MSSEQIPIGRYSQITRLTQKALRLYDQRGLLVPAIKSITGYRYYTADQIEKGIKIKFLVELGFSLSEVENLLNAADIQDEKLIKEIISNRLSIIRGELKKLKKIEELLLKNASLEDLFMSTSEPTIKNVSKIRVISKKDVSTMANIGETVGKLIQEIFVLLYGGGGQGVTVTGPPMFLCHDEVVDEKEVHIEIAVPITGKISISEDFEIKNLDAGKVVSTIHKGSYSTIAEAYTRIFEYAQKNNLKIVGPTREIYLSNPQETPESELFTEVQLPIE